MEEWKYLPTELMLSNYQVSSMGRLRNKVTGYISNAKPRSAGYISVNPISDSGELRREQLHMDS